MTDCRDAKHEPDPLPQEHVEEYLEVLRIAEEKGDPIAKISWVADKLSVARPSVVQMFRKLAKGGFVKYRAREGVLLTEKGRKIGTRIMRNHRMMEAFVKATVGEELDEKVGCAIEHTMSQPFTDTICTWLKHPRKCPHGYMIPPGKCCPPA